MAADDPGDAVIVASMAAVPARLWERLFGLADALGTGAGHVSWQEPAELADGSVVVGYPVYSAVLRETERLLYDLGVIVPFDWPAWQQAGRCPRGQGVADASAADAARLATAIFRGERFCDGTIAQALADGTLTAILARLRRWFQAEHPGRRGQARPAGDGQRACRAGGHQRGPGRTLSQVDNPWGDLPSQAPYLLPSDAPYVHAWNELQQDRHDARLYLDYPPEPFLGRLDAPLVLLSANPHFDPADNSTWGRREVVDAALASVSSAEGSSFLWLREELAGTAGAAWWRPRVAQLAQTCAELVDHLLVVEFHGYHSPNWQPLPVTLPSQGYSFSLVRRAMERGAVIVALRAWREWQVAVPGLRHYQKLARTKSAQNSHLTVGNIDPDGAWGLICRALPQRP